MPQDKLELSLRDSLAISAALRLSLSDLFSRIRGIAAHEAMLTPYMRQELEGVLQDGYRLLRPIVWPLPKTMSWPKRRQSYFRCGRN